MGCTVNQINCLSEVREQYENYPYPSRNPEDEKQTLFLAQMSYLAKINHYCFKGKQNFNNSFKVLDAGGGTGDCTILLAEQLRDTDAQIVYLDISSASMDVAKQRAKIRELDNIKWVNGSLLDIDKMGLGKFDYINCSGVLHHLKNPDDGLRSLRNALSENGAIGIMVYGQHGRNAVYHMQQLLRLVNTGPTDVEIMLQNTKAILDSLPKTNAFKKVETLYSFPENKNNNIELYDLFLHSQDRAYTVPQIYQWVNDCGLNFVDFVEKKILYKPQTFIKDPDLLKIIQKLPIEKQQAIAEMMSCLLKLHIFFVSTQNDTVVNPNDWDNIPYFYRYSSIMQLYDKIKDTPHGTTIKINDPIEGAINLVIGKYTKHILKHLSGNISLKEMFDLIRTELYSQNKPSDEELFNDFMNIYKPLNLLDLIALRHKSVPAFKTELQIQNRIKQMYN